MDDCMADLLIPTTRPGSRSLRADEERMLLERVQHGDQAARDELVERMLPFVRQIARAYADRGELLEDLVQVGAIGLVNAIDRFDLGRGLRLSTFAGPNISGEIKRHFRDRAWAVRTPRDLQELYAVLRAETEVFSREHGRSPTVRELCELTGRAEEQVLDALSAGRNFRAASLDMPATDDDGSSLGDTLGGDDERFARAEDRATLDRGLRALGERERRIVLLRFVQGLSQREIAAQVGVSQMHVSRLLRRSIDDLRATIT
jgi:RNA polymerase sigma-B factor